MDCLPHFHVAAYHAEAGYNGDTPGIGVLCPMAEDVRLAAGTYFNSLRKQSTYAGAAWQPWRLGVAKVGAYGGFTTGYRDAVSPFAAMAISLPVGALEAHVVVIPEVPSVIPATVGLSFSIKF